LLALLLVALAVAGLLELRAHRLRVALDAARISPPRPVEPAELLAARLQQARRALDDEKLAAAERVERERRRFLDVQEQLDRERKPQINTPLLSLSPQSAGARGAEAQHLALPRTPGWVVLSLDLEGKPAPAYRASLLGPHGARLWSGAGLVRNRWDALVISVPSTLLKPGEHQVRVEAIPLSGAPVPVARFAFRVERGDG
jgi:hypothetical protein